MKKAIEGGNTADIKAKSEELKQASYKIAEELYKQQAAAGAAGAQPGADGAAGADAGAAGDAGSENKSGFDKGSADDVEYEVKDDDK